MKTKAAILQEYQKPLMVEEVELDKPKAGEVLVKMRAAGLCHSDLSIMNGIIRMPPLPCIPGHEGAGVIQEVGPGVTRVKAGDSVILMWVPVCGECYYCRREQPQLCLEKDKTRVGTMLDGSYRVRRGNQNLHIMMGIGTFREYAVVSERSILPIPSSVPLDIAAVVGCGVVTGIGAVLNKAQVKKGSSVAVVGIGGVGLNIILGAVLANATQIIAIDLLDNKLELAKQFGATHLINASKEDPVNKVKDLTGGFGADYSFEVIGGTETALLAYNLIRRGGYAVIVGIPGPEAKLTLPLFEIPLMEKSVLGTYYGSGDMRNDMPTFLRLYEMGRLPLDKIITQRYRLEEINQGFKDLEAGKNARGVIVF
jgi:S-(hydroxymethyl)glutathione dehydrogenase / alcohol dehydrogenase